MLKNAVFAIKQQDIYITIKWLKKMSEPWVDSLEEMRYYNLMSWCARIPSATIL